MSLWIRSQDKEKLVKINSLQYGEYQGTHYINGYCINEVDNIDLGIYATKERALEVLDEINDLLELEEIFHIRKSSLNNLDELAEPKYILNPVGKPRVFTMPNE